MRRFVRLAAVFVLLAIMLSGCGQAAVTEDIQKTTLVIDGKGGVTAYLVGEFDKAYYNLSELTTMARDEAAEFSAGKSGAAAVTVEKVEAAQDGSSRVVVEYVFDGTESYRDFLGEQLFYGTVSEAIAQGYCRGVELKDVNDGSLLSEDDLMGDVKKHLVVTNTAAVIYCPDKVSHIGGEAFLNQDGSVDTTRTEGVTYILLKK